MDLTDLKTAIDGYQSAAESAVGDLKARMDALECKDLRPRPAPDVKPDPVRDGGYGGGEAEYKSAFFTDFIMKGDTAALKTLAHAGLDTKALSTAGGADGSYGVPTVIDSDIEAQVRALSPIRQIARVKTVETSDYKRLVSRGNAASGWVGETDARAETATPGLEEVAIVPGELYANAAATQRALDDMQFDAEAWLMEDVAEEFAAQEGAAFITGDGMNKPKGFLSGATANTADGARAFGTLQHLETGVAGGWPASDPADVLIDLVHSLNPRYRAGAVFVMNAATLADVRKFKDADGNFLWRPGLIEGQADTLLGYPVVEAADMPDIASDSLSVAFGNFERGYTIVERTGTRVLRDPYSNKPYVNFYATRRVGGAVVNDASIKLLKFAAS